MKQTREILLAREAAALAPTLVGDDDPAGDPRSAEAARAAMRALAAPTLGPREAHALLGAALERAGGPATLALAARLAIDRRRRPVWLRALVVGLGARPRAELWAPLALAID